MSENVDGPTVVVVAPGGEAEGGLEGGGKIQDGDEVEAAEVVTDAAVEIAQIEADRDITVAAIQAEAATEQTEAMLEASAQHQELEEWRTRAIAAEASNTDLQTELETLRAQLTPPPSAELPANPPEPEPSAEAAHDPVQEDQKEAEAAEPEKPRKRRHRWI